MATTFYRKVFIKGFRLCDIFLLTIIFSVSLAFNSNSYTLLSLSHILLVRVSIANLLGFSIFLFISSIVFSVSGLYQSHRLSSRSHLVREAICAVSIITGLVAAAAIPLDLSFATPIFLLRFWLLMIATLIVSREFLAILLHVARARGRNLRNVVVVGDGPLAVSVAVRLSQDVGRGYRIVQVIDTEKI